MKVILYLLALSLLPASAECQLCYSGPCINSSICGDCFCAKQGLEMEGVCVAGP